LGGRLGATLQSRQRMQKKHCCVAQKQLLGAINPPEIAPYISARKYFRLRGITVMNSRILKGLYRLGAAIHERRQRARTAAELSRLTDRQLADIGISRGDIPSVAARGRRF